MGYMDTPTSAISTRGDLVIYQALQGLINHFASPLNPQVKYYLNLITTKIT
jgi:hypothetical protein